MPTMMQLSQPMAQPVGQPLKQMPSLSSSSKINYDGIEVVEGVTWQGWEPGREYTKHIILKNVKVKTQKLKYKVPNTRFFSTLYPKPIVLSAGTSFSLPVTFRPLEKNIYEDKIEFHSKGGAFDVPIKALLPQVDIQVPEELNFNMCAAKDLVEASFEVANTGDLETTLCWEVTEPFIIDPPEVTLRSQQTQIFRASFKPASATVYQAEAVCRYGPDFSHCKVTKLKGIGKFPHILVSNPGKPSNNLNSENMEATVEFGQASVGSTIQRWVELHNLSPVRAPYKVDRPPGVSPIDSEFVCPQKHGVVPPMSSIRVPMLYSPHTVGTKSIDYFHIIAIGNIGKSVVKCTGSSKGPSVHLGATSVNFMQIDVGDTATRTVEVVNMSDMEAVFQFMIDCNESVFKFEKTTGVLKPNSKMTIILKFHPQLPINYYRRITCLVHNQGPVFLDLLGTCHAEMVKPAVLLKRHIDRYQCHVARGFSVHPPEQLNELLREGKLEVDDAGALMMPQSESVESFSPSLPDIPPMDEYFNDGFHCDVVNFIPHVSMDINVADFGNCQNLRITEDKVINITNHTKGKITIQWIVDTNKTFSVVPSSMDVPPLKSATFSVSFKPNAPNQFYGAELECFTYYKSLRDYRLVEDTTHCPPWCLTLTCTGHTFMPNNETFLPRYNLDSPRLIFPAVNARESTYRTMLMTNIGTTPIHFDMRPDPANTYTVKPAKALMTGEHQIFVVKITPAEVKKYNQTLTLRLNDNAKYNQELQVWGSAESPEVLLDTEGVMYFKPTCIGTASQRVYKIKNISRIPLRFEWKLKHADQQLLSVTPEMGIIQPNEVQSHTWSFVPKGADKYVMKPAVIVWGQGFSSTSSGGKKKQFTVRAVGEGSVGDVRAEQSYHDFGDVVVGSSAAKHVVLFNNSPCSLHFRLFIDQTIDGPYPEEITRDDRIGLDLESMEGVIPARSKHTILTTVIPVRRVTYQFALSYQLLTPEGKVAHVAAQEPQHLCHILATGVFPMMAVSDARCYGSAIGISKKQLWTLFSLDNMNMCLDSDPSADELMYSVATRHSHTRRPPVYTRAILDFNFSAAPIGSEPCVVNLMFENTGTVPTEWAFLFPTDLQLELEYWAETGEFDEDELHQMKVMDNNLFTVEPQKGQLQPGDCQTVTFTYQHTMAGTDRLPVLLKLSRGREILLNFIGVTVELERRYLHFPSSKHMFTPVPVGEKISPKQIYELYNGGAVPVYYQLDLTPLELIQQENFDQPVFECLNPAGEIAPGRTVSIEWRFSPVEAKTYMVDVPIHVHNGETAIVTFTGVGYDKRIMGDTMPMTDQQDLTGVPGVQSVPVPGQLVYLSQERLSFGNMPLFSRARRMIFVTNQAKDRCMYFEWHVTTRTDCQYLSISPVTGTLQPGESMMCRVTFLACGVPSFYDLDLVCEVTDELKMSEYRKVLSTWEKERERQKYEFVITENDLDADKRLPNVVEVSQPSSSRLQLLEKTKRTDSDSDLSRYKTLPPIRQLSPDQEKAAVEEKKKEEEEYWEKPTPPAPFLLHLGLTARTHDIGEFQNNFPEEYRNFFIDRMLSQKLSTPIRRKQRKMKKDTTSVVCTQAESDVLSGVLSNVIRGLLDDTYFHEAIRKVSNEKIPYFHQIGERPQSAPEPLEPTAGGSRRSSKASVGPVSPIAASPSGRLSPQGSVPSSAGSHRSLGEPTSETSVKSTKSTPLPPRHSKEELQRVKLEERKMKNKQTLKKLPEFGNAVETLIENSMLNVMSEVLNGEFSITARPRFIALPKRAASAQSRGGRL